MRTGYEQFNISHLQLELSYEQSFKSFPVFKHFRTHEFVAVLFLKRYGFDISRYQAPIIMSRLLVKTQISAAARVK